MTDANLRISTDPELLDVDRVHRWLSEESYWALGRTRETFETAIRNSLNFGAYDAVSADQLGYARVVTDRATFGWLADVFVAKQARGRGVGKALVRAVREELAPFGLKRVMLATSDAHSLYADIGGFGPLDQPERYMELRS
ncbi:GNAT family N-acetyltransferase [Phaeacidiphilus oryzae]|jgi:GNAT superfamily N-acetyltransferase|uniref:GNAT family N-acetyltransferase n=1 Tax=Phaeacidiphilus oryzae TaxID=348818 RepID=UPI00055FDF8E|nr:GNAT family N-acetyltransferase [Phaeacidiphilus oryzae]